MKIKKVSLQNFRQYRNVQLDIPRDKSGFVVILGTNGYGKSNLLSAISWCLYGVESKASISDSDNIVNWDSLEEAGENELIPVSVEMHIDLAVGTQVVVRRKQQFKRVQQNEARPLSEGDFSVTANSSTAIGAVEQKHPHDFIEKKFPRRLEPYFLFDGERLDSFFRQENRQRVEDAVLEIAKVDRMNNIWTRLDTIGDEIRRDAARKSKDSGLADAEKKKQAAEDNYNNANLQYESHLDAHRKLEVDFREAESMVDNMAEHFENLKVVVEHKEKIARLSEKKSELSRWATKNLPLLIMEPQIRSQLATVEQRQRDGTLPPDFRSDAIVKILTDDQCVCGRHVKDSEEASRNLNRILSEIRSLEGSGQELSDLSPYLQKFVDDLSLSAKAFSASREEIARLNREIIELEERVPSMKTPLIQEGESIKKRYERLRESHQNSQGQLARLEATRNQKLSEFESAKKVFEKALSLDEASRSAAEQSNFIGRCIDSAGDILSEWKTEVRETVAKALREEFQNMLPKENFVESVEITEDFDVQVKIGTGNDIKDDLSAGERQTLAFAFSFGLNAVSGYELPMLIDTPFGRMGSEMKENVSKALARNTQSESGQRDEQQVIILMTDSEYSDEVQAAFADRDPSVFKLSNFGVTTSVEAVR